MAISKNTHHNNCTVKAIRGPFGIHYGKLICYNHNKLIQWLNQADYEAITGLKDDPPGNQLITRNNDYLFDFTD